jgi:hypothetical protein
MDVPEEYISSIFRVEQYAELFTCFHSGFLLGVVIFEDGGNVPPKR